MIDLLYLCHGRYDFTRVTLSNLVKVTDLSLVDNFIVYHDDPCDDVTADFLAEFSEEVHEPIEIRTTEIGSPVGVMNHYLQRSRADLFAKIDNDIIVPRGWDKALLDVMIRHPELELLGMEPGMSGQGPDEELPFIRYGYLNATHIGGVGLMRRSAFQRLPDLVPDGRFGFTQWQHQWNPARGWVQPDLRMFSLDFLPIEPWQSITERYMKTPDLQRRWPKYHPSMSWHWEWWTG